MNTMAMGRAKAERKGGRRRAIEERANKPLEIIRRTRSLRLPVVDTEGAWAIHAAALDILWTVGVIIDDAETRAELLRDHGCVERDGGYVGMPEDLVGRALETVAPAIKLYDREGAIAIDTSSRLPRYCIGHNCVNILDHVTGEHRPGTCADIANTSKVGEALPHVDMLASLGYPGDVPAEEEALSTVRELASYSRKPIAFTAHDEIISEQIWTNLADRVGGWDALADKPCGLDLTGPVSPLKLGDELCRRLKFAARRNLPVVCYPALFPGIAGPITLAGSIVQSSAESLAGVVIHQIANPGAPILAGSSILPMDMRRADLAYGSPEYMLACLGATDYFNTIGLPNWIGAGCSDSHVPDMQAAAEVGANMSLAALSGTSFIHNLGFLSGGRTGSLEMLVLCDELAGWGGKFANGIEVTPETIAVDVIKRSAHENTYLTDDHTVDRYMVENWMPSMMERSDVRMWADQGARDMNQKIRDKLADILR
jgi:trimethylamine--corrinoid protein Co-methyltransferase